MRKTTPLMIAAALTIAGPAFAQNTTDPAATTTANDAAVAPTTGADMNGVMVEPATPTNGLTAGPGAAPETAAPGSVDTAYGEPATVKDDDGFPWGVLGLLGLLGLIPRRRRAEP